MGAPHGVLFLSALILIVVFGVAGLVLRRGTPRID